MTSRGSSQRAPDEHPTGPRCLNPTAGSSIWTPIGSHTSWWVDTGPRAEGDAVTPEVLIEREVTTWQTSLGRIDVLVGIPDADGMPVGYEALQQGAIALRPAGTDIDVEVADLGDIIISKEFAGRSKDTQALPELRRIAGQASDPSRPDR